MRRSVSSPVMPPMRTSIRTRSGLIFGISFSPSSPLEAVVSSISGESKILWNEYCTSASSSIRSNLLIGPGDYRKNAGKQTEAVLPAATLSSSDRKMMSYRGGTSVKLATVSHEIKQRCVHNPVTEHLVASLRIEPAAKHR